MMNILRYAFYRILALIVQMLGAIAVVISITSVIAYDPTIFFTIGQTGDGEDNLSTSTRSDEEIAELSAEIGLDKTAIERYFDYITDLFTKGDMGNSWYNSEAPVTDLYLDSFLTTLKVFGLGIVLFTILAVVLGILSARRLNGSLDKNVRFGTSVFYSFPPFVLGTLLIVFTGNFFLSGLFLRVRFYLSDDLGYNLDNQYMSDLFEGFINSFTRHTVYSLLPIITVILIYTGFQFRLVRIYISDVLNQNYIRTAHAKGLDERTILIKHGLRNALPELITSIATTFPVAFSGVVVLEKVFEIEGSGLLLINSGLIFDWPVLIGGSIIFTALNAIILSVSDFVVHYVNPLLRLR